MSRGWEGISGRKGKQIGKADKANGAPKVPLLRKEEEGAEADLDREEEEGETALA